MRRLLIAFAILSIALYVTTVRPTALAERLVAAAERGDFATINSLLDDEEFRIWLSDGKLTDIVGPIDRIYVEIMECEWSDWWGCRRRLIFRTARHTNNQGHFVDWTEDDQMVAHITRVEICAPRDVRGCGM
jgi:hypothetical protein